MNTPDLTVPRARARAFIATSADGFIAREDGAIDWLTAQNARVTPGEDCGYAAFVAGVDALVMGRRSFDSVLGFDPWPYAGLPVVVMSRRGGVMVPEALHGQVTVSDETPAALLARLGREGRRAVYVDGGELIRTFLRDGLLDEITVTTVPVLLGRGRPLWGGGAADRPADVPLTLRSVRHWDFGFVQTRWGVGAAEEGRLSPRRLRDNATESPPPAPCR